MILALAQMAAGAMPEGLNPSIVYLLAQVPVLGVFVLALYVLARLHMKGLEDHDKRFTEVLEKMVARMDRIAERLEKVAQTQAVLLDRIGKS